MCNTFCSLLIVYNNTGKCLQIQRGESGGGEYTHIISRAGL